jgi:hypothetical protein
MNSAFASIVSNVSAAYSALASSIAGKRRLYSHTFNLNIPAHVPTSGRAEGRTDSPYLSGVSQEENRRLMVKDR